MLKKTRLAAKVTSLILFLALAFVLTLGLSASVKGEAPIYQPEATSAEDSLQRANKLNEQIAAEGSVLLKNSNDALPIAAGSKVSVLGKSSVNPQLGGGGSSAGESGGAAAIDVFKSLSNAGFIHNPVLEAFYRDNAASGNGRPASSGTGQSVGRTGETPMDSYTQAEKDSFADYDDFAIVFITRVGGEGWDLFTKVDNQPGRETKGQHYLQLDTNEEALIEMATENFDKVVVVLNISTTFQIGDLENNEDIDAILWIGLPGATGLSALGRILSGEVNPSGKTFAVYPKDFKKDPTWQNFATNAAVGNRYLREDGTNSQRNFVEYEEGIYLGYRYYETRGFVEGGTWYDDNVVYPFGYGLSYTEFEWEVQFPEVAITAETVLEVAVKVTNIGKHPGKDVVQLYMSAPYYDGEIEKAHVVLVGFAKTKLLKPGETDTVHISVPVYTMASYDFNDANFNEFIGYEVEKGDYTFYVGTDSHQSWKSGESKVYNVATDIKIENDPVSGVKVENQFEDISAYFGEVDENVPFSGRTKVMSRADFTGTFPTEPTADDLTIGVPELDALVVYPNHREVPTDVGYDSEDKPWYVAEMPTYATTRATDIKLTELVGKPYDDELWDDFMDQFTLEDYADIVANGFFGTLAFPDLDIPVMIMPDGPTGFVKNPSAPAGYGAPRCFYASPIVVASTWNVDLALEQGEVMGDEGLWMGFAGIYAPATNMHRSPFSGRNFEYYSDDPLLAGKMAGAVTKGLQSKGISVYLKHFALNDQETNRAGIATWADEQTIREIYLKSFEIAVKDGNATGIMTAFNRVGATWAGASYPLLTNVLRGEWGFRGAVITDWANGGWMNMGQMVRAGNDFYLAMKFGNYMFFGKPTITEAYLTPSYVAALKNSSKNVLYTVANSAAMNTLRPSYAAQFTAAQRNLGTLERGDDIALNVASIDYEEATYELVGAPKGISINSNTGQISGKIATDAIAGDYVMTVTLRDATGLLTQAVEFRFTVEGGLVFTGDAAPEIIRTEVVSIDVGSTVLGATGIEYEISAGTLPAGLVLTKEGRLVGSVAAAGTHTFTVKATLGEDVVSKEITLTVKGMELFYEVETVEHEGKEGEAVNINVATIVGAENVTYTATGLPAGLTISADGVISGTPTEHGTFNITITASADGYEDVTTTVTITVEEKEAAPDQPEKPEEEQPEEQPEEKKSLLWLWIVLGVVAVAGIGAGVFFFLKKKKK